MDDENAREEPGQQPARESTTPAGHRDPEPPEGTEPDFTDTIGTSDPLQAVEDGESFFPPTDPVIEPASNTEQGAKVVGGFTPTSMDDVGVEGEPTAAPLPGDEQLLEAVVRELHEDAMTTDLRLVVHVRDGVVRLHGSVPSLQDADAAMDVASRVEGVAEVLDELVIEGQAAR